MKILSFNSVDYFISDRNLVTGIVSRKEILHKFNFNVGKGEAVAIAGESGSGKTTIAKLASGLIEPTNGTILFKGENINRNSGIQILFQNNDEILNPFRKVRSILREAFRIKEKSKLSIDKKIEEYFELLKLNENIMDRIGSELSGGERIRIALIRILAVDPELLILDEPFSAQDKFSVKNFVEIFENLKMQKEISLLIVSHNIKAVKTIADKLTILKEGRIVESGDYDELINKPVQKYTKFLIDAERYDLNENDFDIYKT